MALTFDDGPNPYLTPKILKILKKHNVKATFFLVGKNVEIYPELVRKIKNDGHNIGNHSYDHQELLGKDKQVKRRDIAKSQRAILRATGQFAKYYRPPYGKISFKDGLYQQYFYHAIGWSLDTRDWSTRATPASVIQIIEKKLRPGAVILVHDNSPLAEEYLDELIVGIRDKGYAFLTMEDFLEKD